MSYSIITTNTDSSARLGCLITDHGNIETPIFMPVGTVGTVKSVFHRDLHQEIKAQIILGNTYHLNLRPGLDTLQKAGGLHKFSSWNAPILTDSGGFQVFSLAKQRKITEQGVTFRSHIDGTKYLFTPENVVDAQRIIGSDILMAFDECPSGTASYEYAEKSLALTEKWLTRCLSRFDSTEPLYGFKQMLFPIVQGCVYPDLRKRAAENIAKLNREGNAIGGLAVGEPTEKMYEMIALVNEILPKDKPRYLMGVGTPVNLLEAIDLGVDMFDCVMPTRNARNGMLFTSEGIINIRNKKWQNDFSVIDQNGTTHVDKMYTKAYLRHLFVSDEMLGAQIASLHNLGFYLELMRLARLHIQSQTFKTWKNSMVLQLQNRL